MKKKMITNKDRSVMKSVLKKIRSKNAPTSWLKTIFIGSRWIVFFRNSTGALFAKEKKSGLLASNHDMMRKLCRKATQVVS
jgi:hypothetical protein